MLSETDVTGRRMPHRRARPRARAADGFFDDLEVGQLRRPSPARGGALRRRDDADHGRHDPRLPHPGVPGSDRLYLPVEQIDAITPYSGGESPTLSKMGGADWQRTRARAKAAAGEVAAELVQLYRRRLAVEGHAFSADTPWQAEMESSFPSWRPRTNSGDRRRQGRHGGAAPDGPARVRRRGLRQDRGGRTRRLQGGAGRQPGGGARPHHAAGEPARADLRRPLRALSGPRGAAQSLPLTGPAEGGRGGTGRRQRRRRHRHAPALGRRRRLQAAGTPGRRRGAALRRHAQGGHQARWPRASTC